MTLPRQWQKRALALLERAGPLEREYFRSVELSYAHPDDVINGEGTRLYGGRFVRPGVRAVYGSAEDTRQFVKRSLAKNGWRARHASQWRITRGSRNVIAVKLAVHVDLTAGDPDVEALLSSCLGQNLGDSQEIDEFWRQHGGQGVVYPSAVPGLGGANVAVFRDVAPPPEIVLANRDRIVEKLRRLSRRFPS